MHAFILTAWSVCLCFLVLFWMSVVSCVLPKPVPQPLEDIRAKALTREDFNLELVAQANREASYLPDQFATVTVHNMPELADVDEIGRAHV